MKIILKFDKKKRFLTFFGEYKLDHKKTWQTGITYVLILFVSISDFVFCRILISLVSFSERDWRSAPIDSMNEEV